MSKNNQMRVAEKWVYKQKKNKIYNMLLRVVCACDIPATVKIGENFSLPHNGLGVVVHGGGIIGNNCTLYQNVTIGGNAKVKDGKVLNSGAPTLENGVFVFAGACVLGPITIGHDSYIGANAVVTKDVPPNSIVVGNNIIKPRTFDYNTKIMEKKDGLNK